jgi:glycosyltransferase involved in cell wall biosynthesis
MTPMRIAFPLGGTDFGKSGVGVYTREVLRRMVPVARAAGHDVLALGTPTELRAYSDVLLGVDRLVAPFDKPGPSALWYAAWCGEAARRAGASVLCLPAANRRIARFVRIPVVGVVHDLAQAHVKDKYDRARMFYFRRVLLPAISQLTRAVAVSEATRADIEQVLGPAAPPVDVVLNGVDSARFRPKDASDVEVTRAWEKLGIAAPYVLYAARLEHPGKNHVRLVEAFAQSRARDTHTLVLAGKDWGAASLIADTVRAKGLEGRVKLLGFVDDALMPALVGGADVVAMMGLHEGFGLPALEAISAGRPVVASSTGALPEVVGPLGVIVDPFSVAAIAAGLDRAISDDVLRARVRAEGPASAEARDWSHTAEGLLRVCEAAVVGSRP